MSPGWCKCGKRFRHLAGLIVHRRTCERARVLEAREAAA